MYYQNKKIWEIEKWLNKQPKSFDKLKSNNIQTQKIKQNKTIDKKNK